MSVAESGARQGSPRLDLTSPWLWTGLFLAVVALCLALPLRLPIGSNYWDLAVYIDGAHRLALGQMPHVDFFAPVGGLSYVLYLAVQAVAPEAHPLLIVQWCILLVALPPLLVTVEHVARTSSRGMALALLLPFLVCVALPVNGLELYAQPGLDGYGNYNRHIAQLLYVLVAALWFLPATRRMTFCVSWLLLAMAGIKITGFIVALPLVVHAALAGRLTRINVTSILLAVLSVIYGLDVMTGVVRAYLVDIAQLVSFNSGGMLGRVLTVLSLEFDVIVAALLLAAVLVASEWQFWQGDLRGLRLRNAWSTLSFACGRPSTRVLVTLAAGTVFETQNTGSQEFISLWPAVLSILPFWWRREHPLRMAVLLLAMTTVLPSFTKIIHRGARAIVSAPTYASLNVPELGSFGRVSAKPLFLKRADMLLAHYTAFRPAYEATAAEGENLSYTMYSEIDYQLGWLKGIDQAITALKAHEARTGHRFETLYSLDFVDLFPAMLGRGTPLHVPIGLDAYRTFPPPDAQILAEVAAVDGILVPTCPVTAPRNIIAERFAPAFEHRAKVKLTDCWELRPKN